MDADLQDPPEALEQFVTKWQEGAEVVYAVRRNRKEGWLKRLTYAAFYRTMKAMAHIDVPLDAGDFCLLDRRVVDVLVSLREQNRFLRGLRSWVGFTQVGVPVERAARYAGVPKYTLRKLVRLALSGYIGFSALPLRAASWLGFVSASAGFMTIAWVLLTKLTQQRAPQGWASTLAVVLFIGGLNMIILGIIGEYLSRVYDEVRRRPLYLIRPASGVPATGRRSTGSPSRPEPALEGRDG
jgi:dolichol-phosphate mannosyltransferase